MPQTRRAQRRAAKKPAAKDLAGLGAEERANLLEYRRRAALEAKLEAQHTKRYNTARKNLFSLSTWEIVCLGSRVEL